MNTAQEEFDKMEKKVLEHLQNINSEIIDSISILRKKDKSLLKSEIALAFIGADTFSRFYELLQSEVENGNKQRFVSWMDNFVFVDENECYLENKKEINCDSEIAWKLRNALIHFYGRPKDEKESIILSNATEDYKEKLRETTKKIGFNCELRFINPYYLIKVVQEGLLIQLKEMIRMIKEEPNEYIEGVKRCYEVSQDECTNFIDFNKLNN